jgi:hypothetical protein
VRHQQTIELLLHQFRSLAPQHDLGTPQMGLQLISKRSVLGASLWGELLHGDAGACGGYL